MEYQENLALNWKLKISTRKEIFPPLSLPFLLEQIEFLPRGARLIDEIRSGSSRNSFSRPIFLRLHFFFFSTRGENCRYKNRYSIRERGWKKNGSLAGSCLLSRFMNFQATIIRPLKGGENNDLLFFLSLSLSPREAVGEEECTIERPGIWKKRGFKLPLVLSSVRERPSDENWNVVAALNARNILPLFCPRVFSLKKLCLRVFSSSIRRCKYHGTMIMVYCFLVLGQCLNIETK